VIDQLAFADMLTFGVYERHVVRARHVYRHRRDRLIGALAAALPRLVVRGTAAGMQLLLSLPNEVDDVAIASAAASQGIGVRALSPLHLTASPDRGLLLDFGRLSETQIDQAVSALSATLFTVGAVPRR
jgi:GntR family transcriptional regulator/MocR family aminotransferase